MNSNELWYFCIKTRFSADNLRKILADQCAKAAKKIKRAAIQTRKAALFLELQQFVCQNAQNVSAWQKGPRRSILPRASPPPWQG